MSLKHKLEIGAFALLAEIEPPKGTDVSPMITNATRVKGDVDAFVVPEMHNAVMRMSSLGAAMLLREKGLETVMQVCCRDRNRLALQADLLAAHACGIHHVMAVDGEDPSLGDHHQAKAVYDLSLMELLQAIGQLRNGRDLAGVELTGAPEFTVGAGLSAAAQGGGQTGEMTGIQPMIDAGCSFFVVPPVFDPDTIDPILEPALRQGVRIIPTVLLLKSLGMARYIERHLNHIHIPEAVIRRLEKTADKTGECVRIASETVLALKTKKVGGVMLSTMGWEHKLPDILEGIKG